MMEYEAIPFTDPPEDGCWNCELNTAMEHAERHPNEEYEKNKQILRKLANNPILSKETQEAIRFAAYRMDDIIWLRKINSDLRETIKNIGGDMK